MAGIFRSLVDGFSELGGLVTANINPYKVHVQTPANYEGKAIIRKEEYLRLYKMPGCYECVFVNPAASSKWFSIYRLSNEGEALAMFSSVSNCLLPLATCSSSLYQEETLQKISDAIRRQQTWTCAHIAAYLGLFEAFNHKDVERHTDKIATASGVTPLMAAIMGEQLQCLKGMLRTGAPLDRSDFKGNTVYHHAVQTYPQAIDVLVQFDNHGVINWLNEKGLSPLHLACKEDKPKAVEMLLSGGANPSAGASGTLPIHTATRVKAKECVEQICKKHPDQINAREEQYGGTPLHWAKSREMVELLCQMGADVNAVSKTGFTPLQVMLMKERTECLMELLCYGSNCNIGDSNSDTPLHWAVQRDDVELVRTFIVFGTNVNLKNKQNQTSRHMAATSKGKHRDEILNLLHVSGARRCSADTKGCLSGCSLEGRNNGKAEESIESLLKVDKEAIFDEMLCSAVSTTVSLPTEKSDAVLDMVDAPVAIGDRVLCLDGGGIRGLILIQILMAIEEAAGIPIKECFDWIAGTSTGGLLALGIATDFSLPYIKGIYFRLKDEVFKGSRPYPSEAFENMLKKEFGEKKMMTDILHPKVIMTGVLADRYPAELHLFRSYHPTLHKASHHSKKEENNLEPVKPPHEQPVWEAARCSGAAPTYFRTYHRFVDGGMVANNPTLDALAEIHEYNTGLKLQNKQEEVRPLGCVISLGCGRIPTVMRRNFDVFRPEGILDAPKAIQGAQALINLLIDQATIAEGEPVSRARAWCSMINVPYFRFSPRLSADIPLDCRDNKTLITMMWETQCYIVANKHRIQQVADMLRAGRDHK